MAFNPEPSKVLGANGQLTAEQMRQMVATDEAAREQACAQAITVVLKEFDCKILARPGLTADGRITASVTVKAR